MNEDGIRSVWDGIAVLLLLTPVGMAVWMAMLWLPLLLLGKNLRTVLYEIDLPEAVFFGMYAVGSAILTGALFSRFV